MDSTPSTAEEKRRAEKEQVLASKRRAGFPGRHDLMLFVSSLLSAARETDGVALWKKPLRSGLLKPVCCCSMTHEAELCKEIKSREKYTSGLLAAGGYMSG